jgi:MYXO-CTERM domain-containing protein
VVADDADPGSHPPAHAVHVTADVLYRDDVGTIAGCIVAMEGTTVTGEWTFWDEIDADWIAFAEDAPVLDGAFELAFAPPEALWGRFAVIRVVATDPEMRTSTAFVQTRLTVLATDRPQECDAPDDECTSDDGAAPGSSDDDASPVPTTGDGDETTGIAPSETSSGPEQQEPEPRPQGCGCGVPHGRDGVGLAGLGTLAYAATRRRRRRE